METSQAANTKRIAWLVGGIFFVWSNLAVAASLPGCAWLRELFASACHQRPDRSYSLAGHPVGLCVRCLWIYLGLACGHPLFAYLRVPEKVKYRLLYSSLALMLADVALETIGVYDNVPLTRAVTGAFFGLACSAFTLRGLSELSLKNPTTPKPI